MRLVEKRFNQERGGYLTNKAKLNSAIKESGKTITHLAMKMGISRQTFYHKMENDDGFTAKEIKILCDELDITKMSDMKTIFFANGVA